MVQQRVQTSGPLRVGSAYPTPASYPYYLVGDAPVATTTTGTDVACTNGTIYVGAINIIAPAILTGISYLIGSVGGTDKVVVELFDESGAVVANSATAGVTVGTTATFQRVPFTAVYTVTRTGIYYVGLVFNGTTAKFRAVAFGDFPAGSVAHTFGTPAAIVAPTTFTASLAPYAQTY